MPRPKKKGGRTNWNCWDVACCPVAFCWGVAHLAKHTYHVAQGGGDPPLGVRLVPRIVGVELVLTKGFIALPSWRTGLAKGLHWVEGLV